MVIAETPCHLLIGCWKKPNCSQFSNTEHSQTGSDWIKLVETGLDLCSISSSQSLSFLLFSCFLAKTPLLALLYRILSDFIVGGAVSPHRLNQTGSDGSAAVLLVHCWSFSFFLIMF
ncbi:hypothetical protein ILYODFUR_035262 [Ilyodon furcidens]|uniref:Uncharacterized protein n=1 Tax=Ilyodon furcidens TaxID=33524 RepID=A0ABV0T564_9TELE